MFLLQIISKLYRELAESWTTMDCFCQITFQKSQPGQPQNIIENATALSIVDSCSPSWVAELTFQWNRPKMAMFRPVRLKMAMFWPTRPNFAMFDRLDQRKNGFDCVCCKLTVLRPTRLKLAMFRLTRPKDKVFDGVWSKPISFGQTQPNENVIERIPLYFEWIEEVSGVSKVNVSTKRKCFQR